jgi:hypothetical protein
VRGQDGNIVEFDVPGAANGMIPTSINADGMIAGTFIDASQAQHAFVRAANGQITVVDEPVGNASPLSTSAASINASGTITGVYLDAKDERHGYVRFPVVGDQSTSVTDAVHADTNMPASTTIQSQNSTLSPSSSNSGGGGSMDALGLLFLLALVSAAGVCTTHKRSVGHTGTHQGPACARSITRSF